MTALALFSSTFVLVFFLGLQTINVANGRRLAAFLTSFGIGLGELILFKLAPDASALEMVAFLSGGPFGVVAAMWLHERMEMAGEAGKGLGGLIYTFLGQAAPDACVRVSQADGQMEWQCPRCGGAAVDLLPGGQEQKVKIEGD